MRRRRRTGIDYGKSLTISAESGVDYWESIFQSEQEQKRSGTQINYSHFQFFKKQNRNVSGIEVQRHRRYEAYHTGIKLERTTSNKLSE